LVQRLLVVLLPKVLRDRLIARLLQTRSRRRIGKYF